MRNFLFKFWHALYKKKLETNNANGLNLFSQYICELKNNLN